MIRAIPERKRFFFIDPFPYDFRMMTLVAVYEAGGDEDILQEAGRRREIRMCRQ